MRDPKQAEALLAIAERDHRALCDMEADIDRRDAVDKIARLLQHVRKVIA